MITKQEKLILAGHRLRKSRCELCAVDLSADDILIGDNMFDHPAMAELDELLDENVLAEINWNIVQEGE